MNKNNSYPSGFLILFLLASVPGALSANNGLNLIGFGVESVGFAGADLAVARDTSALNTNPAGLIQISGRQLDWSGAAVFSIDARHKDVFGNDDEVDNTPIFATAFGYASHVADSRFAWGVGVFGQGGIGYEYPDLSTAFGTTDELSSLFRIAKLSSGIAYEINDTLTLGAALAVLYSENRQKLFPDTSFSHPTDPSQSFFGLDVSETEAWGLGAKVGLLYKLGDKTRIGIAYTTEADLDLEDGDAVADFTALGLGKVRYSRAKVTGLRQPREFGIGISVQTTPKLLVAAEIGWIDWSSAIDRSEIVLSGPSSPFAPPTLSVPSEHDWRDQYPIAVGFEYQFSSRALIRAGYNYARNPIPNRNLNPLLAAIGEHHFTIGAGYRINKQYLIDGVIEYDLNSEERFTNAALPFGPGARAENEVATILVRLQRNWD